MLLKESQILVIGSREETPEINPQNQHVLFSHTSAKAKRRELVFLRVCAAATAGLLVLQKRNEHSCYTCYS